MARIYKAPFVSKEAVWNHLNDSEDGENDCVSGSSNEDDDYWEIDDPRYFQGLDAGYCLAMQKAMTSTPYIRMAGWGPIIPNNDIPTVIYPCVFNGSELSMPDDDELVPAVYNTEQVPNPQSSGGFGAMNVIQPYLTPPIQSTPYDVWSDRVSANQWQSSLLIPAGTGGDGRTELNFGIKSKYFTPTNEVYSDPWPYLSIKDVSSEEVYPKELHLTSSGEMDPYDFIQEIFANARQTISDPIQIDRQILRRWRAFMPILSPSERCHYRPVIIAAGYGYSDLNQSYARGYLEYQIIVYDPRANLNQQTGKYETQLGTLYVGPYEMPMTNWDQCDQQGLALPSGAVFQNGFYSYLIDAKNIDSTCLYLDVTARINAEIINDLDESYRWPRFQITNDHTTDHEYYNDDSNTNSSPNGTKSNPFKTIQAAISYLDLNSIDGSDSSPICLNIEDGVYYASETNPIVVPSHLRLVGNSWNSCIIKSETHLDTDVSILNDCHISNIGFEASIEVQATNISFDNCWFSVKRPSSSDPIVAAIQHQSTNRIGLLIYNCIFEDCDKGINATNDVVVQVVDSDFVRNGFGIVAPGSTSGDSPIIIVDNSIFNDNSEQAILCSGSTSLTINHSAFKDNYIDYPDNLSDLHLENIVILDSEAPLFNNPESFHLAQPISNSNTSPCVDGGRPILFTATGSTSVDGVVDRDQYDIGYHYPATSEYKYVIPKYNAYNAGYGASWKSEVAIQNPNAFEVETTIRYFNMIGSMMYEESCSLEPHQTKEIVLSPGGFCPTSSGSIVIDASGPLFGHCLQKYSTTTYVRSHMTQMQRASQATDDLSSTSLCTGNWAAHFGGGNNIASTEFIINNYHDEAVTINIGRFRGPDGEPLTSAQISPFTMQPHQTFSVSKSAGFALNWGSFEVEASKALVGEMVIISRNANTLSYFSESVIMVPSSMYSSRLIASKIDAQDYGDQSFEDYLIIKNTSAESVDVYIDIFNADGSVKTPDPFPTAVTIPEYSLFGIDFYDLFSGTPFYGSAEISSVDEEKILIGHSESVGYYQPGNRMQIAGSEMDPVLTNNTKYFVPYCRAIQNGTTEKEETWLVVKNLNDTPTTVTISAYDLAGNEVDAPHPENMGTTFTLGAHAINAINYFPGAGTTATIKSLEFDSSAPITGWVERWNYTSSTKRFYDAILMQTW